MGRARGAGGKRWGVGLALLGTRPTLIGEVSPNQPRPWGLSSPHQGPKGWDKRLRPFSLGLWEEVPLFLE